MMKDMYVSFNFKTFFNVAFPVLLNKVHVVQNHLAWKVVQSLTGRLVPLQYGVPPARADCTFKREAELG